MSEKHLGRKNNKAFKQFLHHILRKKGESVFINLDSVHGLRAHNECFEGENQVDVRLVKIFVLKECVKSTSPDHAFF